MGSELLRGVGRGWWERAGQLMPAPSFRFRRVFQEREREIFESLDPVFRPKESFCAILLAPCP